MKLQHLIGAVALLAAFGSAQAAGPAFYAGVAAGRDYDARYDQSIGPVDTQNSAKAWFGWQFADDWSLEAAYHDLGDASLPPIADFGFDTSTDGWSLAVRYVAPLEWPLKPFARLGWFAINEDGSTLTIAGPRRFSANDNGALVEVGAQFEIGEHFVIRGGYEWFDLDGGSQGVPNIGAEIRF